jgi:cellulose synthase/poly-beta-1,6-N-acetylglucosamine synthase-like glycosyltransferase
MGDEPLVPQMPRTVRREGTPRADLNGASEAPFAHSPTLAAIVPATDSPATLPRVEEAIRAALDPPEEVIVLTEPRGCGPALARNIGAARAKADVLVFIDSDIVVHPDIFRRIRAAFYVDPELTAVLGSYDDGPQDPGVVSAFRNLLHHYVHRAQPGPTATFWTGLGAVRRDAFEATGGFDAERYAVPSIEDVEFGRRLFARGARIDLDPRVQGTHLKHWGLADMVKTDLLRRGVPWVSMLLRERTSSSTLNLSSRHRASMVACLVGVCALALRRLRLARSAFMAMLGLNHSFYALLWRQLGPAKAAAGTVLHVVHMLTGVAALPGGVVAYLLERFRARRADA